jgi:hypothetical protein
MFKALLESTFKGKPISQLTEDEEKEFEEYLKRG